jgi:large subunit ribosomal protein L21
MYAIVEIAGHQYKVRKDQQIYVNRLPQAEGEINPIGSRDAC